jgi:hypothetical protein
MGDNIKMDFREIYCEDRKWIELVQDRVLCRILVLETLNLRTLLPQCWCNNFVTFCCSDRTIDNVFSNRTLRNVWCGRNRERQNSLKALVAYKPISYTYGYLYCIERDLVVHQNAISRVMER